MKSIKKYKISVVVATYNSGEFICEFLDSIKAQSIGFDNVEVILVDDSSDDLNTINILKNIDSTYGNVRCVFLSENSGFPGTSRNVGLELATSDYVIFADHDDSYVDNAFEVMLDGAADYGCDVLITNFNQIYGDRTVPFKSVYRNLPEIHVKNIDEDVNLLKVPAAIWTRLFKKSFLMENNIRFLEGMLAEDVYVAAAASLNAKGIVYLNDFYSYNYKVRDTAGDKSTIHVRSKKYIEAILKGYFEIDSMLEKQNKTDYGEIIFRSHLTSWLYTIVLSGLQDNDKLELFEKSFDIFNKYYSEDLYFKKRYNKLVEHILNKDFQKALSESKRLEKIQSNMNDMGFIQRLKNKLKR